MSCCGQKREQIRSPQRTTNPQANQPTIISAQTSARITTPAPANSSEPHSSVRLRYLSSAAIRVTGGATGRAYQFSSKQPLQNVDARDAELLLRTRFFRREQQQSL